jgi:hypothetical protein
MQMRSLPIQLMAITVTFLMFVGVHAPTASAAPIAAGDAIAVDLSSVGGSAANFNVFNTATTITAGSVIRHNGGTVVDGVSLTFAGPATLGFNNDPDGEGWAGAGGDPYYVQAANDLAFETTTGANGLTLTFAGLNDSLTYTLRVYSLLNYPTSGGGATAVQNRLTTFEVTDGAGTQSVQNTRKFRWDAASLEASNMVFSDLQTNGSGQIILRVGFGATDFGTSFLNAAVLEVVPEPASLALMGLGGLMMLPRRRR